MKTYTIVAGVNGCGKSSLTGVLRTEIADLGKIIDVDKITAACGGNPLEGDKKAVILLNDCLEKEIFIFITEEETKAPTILPFLSNAANGIRLSLFAFMVFSPLLKASRYFCSQI